VSRAIASALALLALLAGALPVAAAEEVGKAEVADTAEIVPGVVVVGWRNPDRGASVARARGLARVADLGATGHGASATVLSTRGRSVHAVITELRADPAVAYAEPNYLFSLPDHEFEGDVAGVDPVGQGGIAGVPVSDPATGGQYSLDRMRVRDAWGRSTGGSNLIAVLDTGVQAGHPDLRGRVAKGYDFVNNDTGAGDDNGHGTWVAGIIAANANDGYGIAGITWSDRILPVKIMSASGTGSTADLAAGITWAANRGADVINMSVGGFPYSQAIQDAVSHAWRKGAVLVAAAGNNGRSENFYPASYDHVVSVSATQPEDEFSRWSSFGPKVDVTAPGSSVLTTNCTSSGCPHRDWGSHTYISGTSFATPNVAGVVALIRARHPSFTPAQIVSRLQGTVDDLGYAGRDDRYGLGRVNAYRALGADVASPRRGTGDGLERNNTLATAKGIPRGTTTRPSIYPAGDIDVFAVTVPRAGRLDVRVTGVVDTRAYPWNRSGLPIDPIVELYNAAGTLIKTVDAVWESGTELATYQATGRTRILVRIRNYYANGNRAAYSITPTFHDNVVPTISMHAPDSQATSVSRWITPVARFSERVTNVTTSTVRLRDMSTLSLVPATVRYDGARREVRLTPAVALDRSREYRFELTPGIEDAGGNAIANTRVRFTTVGYLFTDIADSPFADEIEWIYTRGITQGCMTDRFCPTRTITRAEVAALMSRALSLPATSLDYFTDDDGTKHEAATNRIAKAGITTGCGRGLYCPTREMTRAEMAAFFARAWALPTTATDYFTDDNGLKLEPFINRMAAAGITTGCGSKQFCPSGLVTRGEMAAFLYRALNR
jgi:type VII secretion-associated serine protease mycosin